MTRKAGKKREHVWRRIGIDPRRYVFCCGLCGAIRREDGGKNNPCKGKIKVVLR